MAFANAFRMGSSNPVYVAGLLCREPRIALWSIDTTPALVGIDPMSELFPEPATPVTTTSTPSGMSTLSLRRLLAVAPRSSSSFFFQAEDGIRDGTVTGVQTCALPILQATRVTGITVRNKSEAIPCSIG